MNAISKKVVIGVLFFFALLPILSCSLFGAEGSGSVAVSIKIPESIGKASLPSALRAAFAPSSRFIHPDTRIIEAVLAIDGGRSTMRADSSVAEGASSASLVLSGVPYGTHTLTISLYGRDGDLLSRGTTSVSVNGRAPASANVTAVPVTERSFNPGPYGEFGTLIPPADYGRLCVYRVSIPNPGSYRLWCGENRRAAVPLGTGSLALYDSKGGPIALSAADSADIYVELASGDYYVVVDVPGAPAAEILLFLDADLRITMSAPVTSPAPGLVVQDRTRPFSLIIPSGFTGEFSIDFGYAQGRGCAFSSRSSNEILVVPGPDGLISWNLPDTAASIDFKDALLGVDRDRAPFSFAGAPRTFIYDPEVIPADSEALALSSFFDIIDKVNNLREEYKTVIVALRDGKTYGPVDHISIDYGVSVLGGFSPDGIRQSSHGTSRLTFLSNDEAISFGSNASDSLLDSLDIVLEGKILGQGYSGIASNAKITLRNCALSYANDFTLSWIDSFSHSLIRAATGDMTFEGCSIIGPVISFEGTAAYTVNAVSFTNEAGNLRVSNSIISACTVNSMASKNGASIRGISAPSITAGTFTIAGSAVSSGYFNPRASIDSVATLPVYVGNAAMLSLANSLLVSANPADANSAFIYFTGDPEKNMSLSNCVLGYSGDINRASIILRTSLTGGISYEKWPDDRKFGANPVISLDKLSLSSVNPSRPDFLKPSASSPSSLRTGGADLSVASIRSALFLSGITSDYLVRDRSGANRSGNGATGYTIGAYEVD